MGDCNYENLGLLSFKRMLKSKNELIEKLEKENNLLKVRNAMLVREADNNKETIRTLDAMLNETTDKLRESEYGQKRSAEVETRR